MVLGNSFRCLRTLGFLYLWLLLIPRANLLKGDQILPKGPLPDPAFLGFPELSFLLFGVSVFWLPVFWLFKMLSCSDMKAYLSFSSGDRWLPG